jgi:ATP-binding cassette, subfamily B, multidrug efflux pump
MSAPQKSKLGAVYDARLMKRLWIYVAPHQRWLWVSLLLLIVTSALGLAQPMLIRYAIDDFLMEGEMTGFGWILGGVVVAILGELVGRAVQTYTLDLAGQSALIDLRLAVFSHLQKLSARFFDRNPIGRLIGRVTTDIESLGEMFASGVVTILGDLINLFAILSILFWLNWQLTLVALCSVPVLLVSTLWVRVRVRNAYEKMVTQRSRINAYLHEQASGMPLVQGFRREKRTKKKFDTINEELCTAQLQSVNWESILSALTDMLGSVTMALILWYGGGLALEGLSLNASGVSPMGDAVTLGTLVAFIQYMERFFGPLNELSMKYTVMQNAMTASERVFRLLDADDMIPEPATAYQGPKTVGHIRFDNVTFGYDESNPVLKGVSFEVKPGEKVAFVGATGAGKTTILKLLTRLYEVNSGAIEIDGLNVKEYALKDLRSRVGIVQQDVFLFAGNILDNIHLGHPEIDDATAAAAADELHLDVVVARLPGGYYEPVREMGKGLSSGERQLISFARVLALRPSVLALDEATSSVDSHMESLLQEAVGRVMRDRTSLIIAHRLSTIRDVDRILVMHKGELVEQGSHAELLSQKGFYWKLYKLQYDSAVS